MAKFDAVDAGLEGFRLTREQPKAVLIWAALTLVLALVAGAILVSLAGEALGELMAAGGRSRDPDPEETLRAFSRVGPALLLLIPIAIVFQAIIYSAIYRAILRPEEGGPGYLKLGGDELRLIGAMILLALLSAGVGFAGAIVLGILATAAAAAGEAAAGLVGFLGVIGLIVLVVTMLVRFSLVLPATFAERRIRVFESWRLTKGRFWPLLGAYVLAIILALVVWLLAMMIYFAIASLAAGGVREAGSVFQPNYGSLGEWLTLAMIIYLLVNSFVDAITRTLIVAPSAVAYRDIASEAGQPAATT